MGLRTRNDRIPAGERAFMLASIKKSITDGDMPVKVRHFGSKKNNNKGGSS